MPESTMIYVTHDQVEAMTLASRIVVLANKGIAQSKRRSGSLTRKRGIGFAARQFDPFIAETAYTVTPD